MPFGTKAYEIHVNKETYVSISSNIEHKERIQYFDNNTESNQS